ncbi:hypothetical protein M569_05552, partial [Genlisea aurea]
FYSEIEAAVEKSNESINKIWSKMKQTGVAASVLWQSLNSVMSSANHEVRAGFELRVAAFLADIVAASENRRAAIKPRPSSFRVPEKGKSMLVAAIMDVITSNCGSIEKFSFRPLLPQNAEIRDIAAAIEVVEEGSMHWDEQCADEEDDDGGKGMKGIGIKVLGGTTVLGLSRATNNWFPKYDSTMPETLLFKKINASSPSPAVVPGLWDDLHSEHVAVPFASWALANWAMASETNRSLILELDRDGIAVKNVLSAPERSVKWHGSWLAKLLLDDRKLPLNQSVSDWSSLLLSNISQASKAQDIPLAQVGLYALLVAIERCPETKEVVMDKGLHLMREAAKRTVKHKSMQESMAKALELLCSQDLHMSLEETQKWSSILLSWVLGNSTSDGIRSSAINILSHILEDYGPSAVPISQGWLTFLITDALSCKKSTLGKGSIQPMSDKVKTQIDVSNVASAAQTANQMAVAVVNLAGMQFGASIGNPETLPLADLLSVDPFAGPFKNLKKDNKAPKITAADSGLATLKGIKTLTELCVEDSLCQQKIADSGALCILRRLLLEDDYEQLAAIEAYDASRARESQDEILSTTDDSVAVDPRGGSTSNLRVPDTAHIRRHAARLLNVLSVLPDVQKGIISDDGLSKWLEDCSRGRIPGCNDAKTRSYSRATLLNVFCCDPSRRNHGNDPIPEGCSSSSQEKRCPYYADMLFLINPDLPHWKCTEQKDFDPRNESEVDDDSSTTTSTSGTRSFSTTELPPFDVVFVHGIRGGPFKSWRVSEDKNSTKSGLVEKIDEEAGKQGTFWPGEWLGADFPHARIFSLKYKTNLTQWSGASLPLQEVSSMLLDKLLAAGIGNRPLIFLLYFINFCGSFPCSMGGLVVKQILFQAKAENKHDLVDNTVGIVFYSCPHFGSKLADMPWRIGLVLRPAPTIGELRSGSPRLVELNDFLRQRHKRKLLDVLSFCETKVTPIVEGYGGWALRMEIVPMESAYPGFGELVV